MSTSQEVGKTRNDEVCLDPGIEPCWFRGLSDQGNIVQMIADMVASGYLEEAFVELG
jgi:hypothetical protein